MSKGMGKKECGGKRRVQNQVLGLFKGWPYQLPIWPHLAKPKICLRHELYHIPEWIQNNVKHQLHRARSLKWLMRLQFSRKKNIREVRDLHTQLPESFLSHTGYTLYLNHELLRHMQDNLGWGEPVLSQGCCLYPFSCIPKIRLHD